MANIFIDKDRRVIPNWRSFKKTVILGELDSPLINTPNTLSLSIDEYIEDWKQNKTIGHAGDLISAATVNNLEADEAVIEAANFILKNNNLSTESQRSLAQGIITQKHSLPQFVVDSIGRDNFHSYIDADLVRNKIRNFKQSIRNYQYNPIAWVELARNYSIIGQRKQAINAMRGALHLAPDNRFVLRSAVRLFAHYDEQEYAHDLLRKNRLTNSDPWLMSAEIALATLRDRQSRFTKKGVDLVNSGSFSSFSLTELASSLGTVELINGSTKKSKEFFRKALLAPNDNSLAQVEWASQKDNMLLDINPTLFEVNHGFEAKALDEYNNHNLDSALENAVKWFIDLPFSKRPVMLGSHIASLVDDYGIAKKILMAGLVSHPNDPDIINNLAYSFAIENNTTEAFNYISKLPPEGTLGKVNEVYLKATKGLAYFRSGLTDEGRYLYREAIDTAKGLKSEYLNWLAILNYAREELLIKSIYVESIMDAVSTIPFDRSEELDIRKAGQEVIELYKVFKES